MIIEGSGFCRRKQRSGVKHGLCSSRSRSGSQAQSCQSCPCIATLRGEKAWADQGCSPRLVGRKWVSLVHLPCAPGLYSFGFCVRASVPRAPGRAAAGALLESCPSRPFPVRPATVRRNLRPPNIEDRGSAGAGLARHEAQPHCAQAVGWILSWMWPCP